jgi:hypothetical protein
MLPLEGTLLEKLRKVDEDFVYSLPDPWKRKLFVALCRRYWLKPYRECGRRYSTVIVALAVRESA